MRAPIAVLLGLWLLSPPALAQDEPEPPPPSKTFDVFDDEPPADDPDLPEGDATDEDEVVPEPEPEPEPAPEPEPTLEPEPAPAREPPPAGPRVLVLLIGEDVESSLTQRIGDEATRWVAEARGLGHMTTVEALDPTADATKRDEIQLGRKNVDDGLLAFEDLDLEAAGEHLETAVNALAAYFGDLPDSARAALSQGIFADAATTLFEGATDQADSIFVALALLDPSFVPAEGRYPSNVVDRFEGVKAHLGARTTGSLTVKTNPPGAAVYVDGLFRGASPLTVSSLADGYHVVSVRRLGFRPLGTLTPVNGDNSATADLELELSKDTTRLSMLDRTMFRDPPRAAALARTIGADTIAVLDFARRLSGTAIEGVLVKSDGTVLVRIPSTDIVEDPELAGRAIADAIRHAEEAKAALALAPPPSPDKALYEEWWFWAVLGGAVAAVATGAAVAATSGGGSPGRNTAIFGF